MLLHAEHRFCIRHLHANCKARGYTGKAFKDEIWGAAWATNVYAFDHYMQKIYGMDKGAHTYLSGVAKQLWSDMLLNSLANASMLGSKSQGVSPFSPCLKIFVGK